MKASHNMPKDPTVAEHLGDVYMKMNEPEKAAKLWLQSYRIDPTNQILAKKLSALGLKTK